MNISVEDNTADMKKNTKLFPTFKEMEQKVPNLECELTMGFYKWNNTECQYGKKRKFTWKTLRSSRSTITAFTDFTCIQLLRIFFYILLINYRIIYILIDSFYFFRQWFVFSIYEELGSKYKVEVFLCALFMQVIFIF